MSKTCEMTMEIFDFTAHYFECGRPAKYITPTDKLNKRKLLVCGIHRNSVDAFYKRVGSNKRCKAFTAEQKEKPDGKENQTKKAD